MVIYTTVSSNQVLQRDPATNTALVRLSADATEPLVLKVGGPYTLGQARNVYVGDIWVMAGQSNMRGYGFLRDPVTQELLVRQPMASVHIFQSNETWASAAADPLHRLSESPRRVHQRIPDPTVRDPSLGDVRGAGLGLWFAEAYREALQDPLLPLGLVASAHGGTSMDQWLDDAQANPDDNSLYGAMRARIAAVGGAIRGILWYQGETDATIAADADYGGKTRELFERMRFDVPSVPVCCVQIGRFVSTQPLDRAWSQIRFEQQTLFDALPGVYGVSSLDGELDDFVHLSARGLAKVGRRLGRVAAHAVATRPGRAIVPRFDRATIERVEVAPSISLLSIVVKLELAERWHPKVEETGVQGFSVWTPDLEKSYPIIVRAAIDSPNTIRLFLNREAHSLKGDFVLCYGYGKDPVCNLVTASGMAPLATKMSLLFP
ncbi:SGNH hydrolase-type esterase domain-containing protein [Dichotomocladium elegans]|nr:SGNH hydrolase-type esterase domain-containing protein [Dichotomocladium elegans]